MSTSKEGERKYKSILENTLDRTPGITGSSTVLFNLLTASNIITRYERQLLDGKPTSIDQMSCLYGQILLTKPHTIFSKLLKALEDSGNGHIAMILKEEHDKDKSCSLLLGPEDDENRPETTTTSWTSTCRPSLAMTRTLLTERNTIAVAMKLSSSKDVCNDWYLFLPDMNLSDREADLERHANNDSHRVFFLKLLNLWKSGHLPEECTVQRLQSILIKYGFKEAAAAIQNL